MRPEDPDDPDLRPAPPPARMVTPPRPVREVVREAEAAAAAPPAPGPVVPTSPLVDEVPDDVETRPLEVDGATWTVRVLGRSRAGESATSAPLLLLGFYPEGAIDPAREAMVVGVTLVGLVDGTLREAWGRGRPVPPPGQRTELFPDISRDRRHRSR